ncbi:hypothetical protein RhiJN_25513 [Ceratobasidium sp. AG-Ba]|nr:hypothetical protein RhiJN_25513 [Ceratobasidium sp. AG-Ba]
MSGQTLASTPELVNLICRLYHGRGLAKALSVSKTFFNAAIPLVWREVAGVHNILGLLSFARVEPVSSEKGKTKDIRIGRERLIVYAPYVQRLEVLPLGVNDYIVEGWLGSPDFNPVENPLLPNLRSLAIGKFGSGGHNQILWIKTLFSSSLTSITVDMRLAPPQRIPEVSAIAILKYVRANCPAIQRLHLFHDNSDADPPASTNKSSAWIYTSYFQPSYYENLAGFQLRDLGCSMRIFSISSVEMLNTLSSLESLNLYAPDYEPPLFEVSLQLPNLKHIGLHYAEPYHIEVVQQSDLLFGLESFEIVFVKGDPNAAELWDEDWRSDTIRWICQCSLLRKLVIDAGVINFVLPTELAEMTSALPLTDVCLKGSVLGSLSDASKFWPKVTRFYWDMSCQLADLLHLTGQPNLQHLGLKLVQSNTSDVHLYNGTPTLPALQTFELLGWPFTLGPDLSFTAQYVYQIGVDPKSF